MRALIRRMGLLAAATLASVCALAQGTWESKAPLPTARSGLGVGELNGIVYAVGGYTGNTTNNSVTTVTAYDPSTNTWTTKAPLTSQRSAVSVVSVGGRLLAIGGAPQGGNGGVRNVDSYDPATNTWTPKALMSGQGRAVMAAGVINGIVYAAGGFVYNGSANILVATNEAYDPVANTWTTKAPLPVARYAMASAVANGRLYVFGGSEDGGNTQVTKVESYNPATDSWTSHAPMPAALCCTGAAAIGGKIYVVGGTAGSSFRTTLLVYDVAANTWTQGATWPTARYNPAVAGAGEALYVIGGTGTAPFNSVATLDKYTPPVTPTLQIQVQPASLDFGGQSMGTRSPSRPVTITNTGSAAVTINSITASAQFSQTNDCSNLAAGATCTIQIVFAPAVQAGDVNSTAAAAGSLAITSNAAGSPHQVTLTGTAEKSLVTHYYRSILRRAPDAGGKTFWGGEAARVSGLGASLNETWFAMAMQFYFSPEYAAFNRDNGGFVTDLYNTFFNRAPDAGGLAFWTNNLTSGMPREVALAEFMFSAEFTSFTNAIFSAGAARAEVNMVGDFYRGLLARLPDDSGFNYWLARFRAAQCSGQAAIVNDVEAISSAFTLSPEYGGRNRTTAQYVGDLYNAFLRRGGDLAGVQFWIGQINSGANTREQVRVQFRDSLEFRTRVAAIVAAGCAPGYGPLTVSSLSKSVANVFSILTVNGAGFDLDAQHAIRFFDSSGFDVEVPAFANSEAEVIAATPPYVNLATGTFGSGTVNVQLIQRSPSLTRQSGVTPGFVINPLPTPGTDGFATQAWLELFQGLGPDTAARLLRLESRYPGSPSTLALREALSSLETEVADLRQAINQSIAGSAQTLGAFGGREIVLDAATREAMDRLTYAAVLALGPNSPSPCPQKDPYARYVVEADPDKYYAQRQQYAAAVLTCGGPEIEEAGTRIMAGVALVAAMLSGPVGLAQPAGMATLCSAACSAALASAQATTLFGAVRLMTLAEPKILSSDGKAEADKFKDIFEKMLRKWMAPIVSPTIGFFSPTTGRASKGLKAAQNVLAATGTHINSFDIAKAFTFPAVPAPSYTLALAKSGAGTVSASPSAASYPSGTLVTASATPDPGYTFGGWSGACSGTLECRILMDRNQSATASFVSTQTNLAPYQPQGWSGQIVVSTSPGTNTDASTIRPADPIYVDWSIANLGAASFSTTFRIHLFVDGVFRQEWTKNGFSSNAYTTVTDFSLGSLAEGAHTLRFVIDPDNVVPESDEMDNQFSKTIQVTNLGPGQYACSTRFCDTFYRSDGSVDYCNCMGSLNTTCSDPPAPNGATFLPGPGDACLPGVVMEPYGIFFEVRCNPNWQCGGPIREVSRLRALFLAEPKHAQ